MVSPGPIETPGLAELVGSTGAGEQRMNAIASNVPLARGRRDEIAKAGFFSLSDDSTCVTGTELVVDGGFMQV